MRQTARIAEASGRYWLIKSEPHTYSFDQLVAEGRTTWDG
ncbi:MAG: EVE domain-containing protein, partial [Polyangiaceae bacterium]